MNIDNIRTIMNNPLWKKIKHNKFYRGHIIIDNYNKPHKQRSQGQFFVLLVFFEKNVKNSTLEAYQGEGAYLSKGETLDRPDPYRFYGTMKMLRFS